MILYFSLFILIKLSVGTLGRDHLLPCFRSLLDQNHDSIITRHELDAFIDQKNTCISNYNYYSYISGELIMNTCDLNKDGVLTLSDWDSPRACLVDKYVYNYISRLCGKCL